jgi:hypothetical protein
MDRELQSSHEQADDRLARDRRPGVTFDRLAAGASFLANFDTTQAVRVKGTIFQFQPLNPHSYIFLDEKARTDRYGADGPSKVPRSSTLPQGCGQGFSETRGRRRSLRLRAEGNHRVQIANPDGGTSIAGRLINAETMVMPDGKEQSWGDYGVHKCFMPGYADQHSTR